MENNCPECGYPLSGNEDKCPECGFIINPQISNESIDTDNWDYSQYRRGLFSQWYFTCKDFKYRDSYDTLNDVLLLLNIIFRILWWMFFPPVLIYIVFGLFAIAIDDPASRFILLGLGIFISVAVFFFVTIPYAIHKFVVPIHRTWRRINKRYWISMAKAVKNNNPNIL